MFRKNVVVHHKQDDEVYLGKSNAPGSFLMCGICVECVPWAQVAGKNGCAKVWGAHVVCRYK